jgi:hypothetical protein
MRTFREVIDDIQCGAAEVYRRDPTRLQRDSQTTKHVVTDHIDRWLWELLQNCDDARATEVYLYASPEEGLLFIADNGTGFKPTSVEAIRGAYYSDKTEGGTIGRKGVGFKSVYNLTDSPKIVTPLGEGVEFNPEKCAEWLRKHGFETKYKLHPWIPFLVTWDEIIKQYPSLKQVEQGFQTVVVLPYKSKNVHRLVTKELSQLHIYTLMTFRHLETIRGNLLTFRRKIVTQQGNVFTLSISTGIRENFEYRVRETTIKGSNVPKKVLRTLADDDRKITASGGVSFLVACPIQEGRPAPFPQKAHPRLHVFYPTKQPAPFPLLLHAEFLVKTDRTSIQPVAKTPFNHWIAQELVSLIVEFVETAYTPELPSAYLRLITPHSSEDEDIQDLCKKLFTVARKRIKLPDCSGQLTLVPEEAYFISQSCLLPEIAREILSKTPLAQSLVHPSFDSDADAQKALRELGAKPITNEDIVGLITEHAPELGCNNEWLVACWIWLNSWLEDNLHTRKERICKIPILPINQQLHTRELIANYWISFPTKETEDLPDWMPVLVIDEEFHKQLSPHMARVQTLIQTLQVQSLGQQEIAKVLQAEIQQYWQARQGDPYRFLRFVLQRAKEREWANNLLPTLADCPVPAYDVRNPGSVLPLSAKKVYFEQTGEGLDLSPLFRNSEEPFYFLKSDFPTWSKIIPPVNLPVDSAVLSQLGVRRVRTQEIQSLLQKSIERFWKQPDDDPYRFLKFIASARAKGFELQLDALSTCPVPAYRIGEPKETLPTPAKEVYMSPNIGQLSLRELFVPEDNVFVVASDPELWTSILPEGLTDAHARNNILETLGVKSFSSSSVQALLERAINRYWQEPKGNPYRFLRFLLQARRYDGVELNWGNLWNCPIPTRSLKNPRKIVPQYAGYSFLGSDWDNPDLERFYLEMSMPARDIHFVCSPEEVLKLAFAKRSESMPSKSEILELLLDLSAERKLFLNYETLDSLDEIANIPEVSEDWQEYVTEKTRHLSLTEIEVAVIYGVRMDSLSPWQFGYLCRILHENWQQAFEKSRFSSLTPRSGSQVQVDACWWYDFRHLACPPLQGAYWQSQRVPLQECWIADRDVRNTLRGLIPEIDLTKLLLSYDEQKEIALWLTKIAGVKRNWEDIDVDEWIEILNTRIPTLLQPNNESHRKQVANCYRSFLEFARERKLSKLDTERLILLCRNAGTYSYQNAQSTTIYLDDRTRYTKHFENEIFVLEIASRLAGQAERLFRTIPVSEKLSISPIISNLARPLSKDEQRVLEKSLPYLFAWACHKNDGRCEEVKQELQKLEWYCDENLQEELSLEGLHPRIIVADYWVGEGRIYIREPKPDFMAKALAEILDEEGRVDFIENVLLKSEKEIRNKLYDEGLNDTDIDEALEAWSASDSQEEDEQILPEDDWQGYTMSQSPTSREPVPTDSKREAVSDSWRNLSSGISDAPKDKKDISSESDTTTVPLPIGYTGQDNPLLYAKSNQQEDKTQESDAKTDGLRLVDIEKVSPDIRVAEQRKTEPDAPSSGGYTLISSGSTTSSLTPEQRKQIEQVGRAIVCRVLEQRGFEVFEMNEANPGFDILARKEEEEYHIEVKSHRLGASKITLTYREYYEYERQAEGGYKWQLWHVQYLEAGNTPQITIYTQIPIEALREHSFSVDLAMCWGEGVDIDGVEKA